MASRSSDTAFGNHTHNVDVKNVHAALNVSKAPAISTSVALRGAPPNMIQLTIDSEGLTPPMSTSLESNATALESDSSSPLRA